jgi:methanethiol oxidase
MVKLDAASEGGLTFDRNFFLEPNDGMRPHQVRLQGGHASSDSFCFA